MLELTLDGPDFDFAGVGTEIDAYCLHNDLAPSTKYRIKLAFEELAFHILRPVLDYAPMLITVEHSEKEDETEIIASYGGERFEPSKSADEFSYQVLQSMVRSLTYHYNPSAEQANTVRILV